MKPIIAVVGGSTCSPDETVAAAMVGRLLSEAGAVILCGGLGGVMEAVAKGARAAVGGVTVGILPGSDPAAANQYIDVPLPTGMGTLSEIALALRIGTPVVGLHDSFEGKVDLPRVKTPAEAVRWALEKVRPAS